MKEDTHTHTYIYIYTHTGAAAGRSYPTPLSPRPRAAVGRSNHTSEARGGGREVQHHIQGAVAAWVQEGLEELSHVEGQEGRFAGAAVKRYPTSKVRETQVRW